MGTVFGIYSQRQTQEPVSKFTPKGKVSNNIMKQTRMLLECSAESQNSPKQGMQNPTGYVARTSWPPHVRCHRIYASQGEGRWWSAIPLEKSIF